MISDRTDYEQIMPCCKYITDLCSCVCILNGSIFDFGGGGGTLGNSTDYFATTGVAAVGKQVPFTGTYGTKSSTLGYVIGGSVGGAVILLVLGFFIFRRLRQRSAESSVVSKNAIELGGKVPV